MELSPEQWAKALEVMRGESSKGISVRAAAAASGVSVRHLKGFINRSRECRVTDEPWVHDVATQFDECGDIQGGILEDELWDRALNGVDVEVVNRGEVVKLKKHDNTLAMKLLAVRNEEYRDKLISDVNVKFDVGELFLRFQAEARLAAAKMSAGVIEGESSEVRPALESIKD